jgi:1,4-alpha-glucan branching enzyme
MLNESVYRDHPDTQVIAEESTAWPMVSRPTSMGGLGFGMKWNMGWMHDTLDYMSQDPIHRRYHHGRLTFSLWYAFNENFVLPLSHDEVVYGKHSLVNKMPGDVWQQFANLRLLYAYMWGHPGKKLLFMGGDIGQRSEWQHEGQVEWHLLQHPEHEGVRRWVADLNRCHAAEAALHTRDFESAGFEWVIADDADNSVVAFLRKSRDGRSMVLVVCNFTPVLRDRYRVGVPREGRWTEILNSDAAHYGGSGVGNYGAVHTVPVTSQGRYHSLTLALPPLGALYLRHEG